MVVGQSVTIAVTIGHRRAPDGGEQPARWSPLDHHQLDDHQLGDEDDRGEKEQEWKEKSIVITITRY